MSNAFSIMVVRGGERTQPNNNKLFNYYFKMSTRRQKKNKKKIKRNDGGRIQRLIPCPPPINDYALTCRKRLRFTLVTNLSGSIVTWSNLIDTIGFSIAANSGYNLFRAVRINFIEIWDAASTQGNINSVSITWSENDSNLGGGLSTVSDTSMSIEPCHVKAKPPKGTLSSEWHVGFGPNITPAFTLTASGSAVIDVDLSFRSSTSGAANGEANALVGAVVGTVFWRGLDGLAAAASKYSVPAGIYQL
jgi:hypothetical protein